MRCLTVAKQTSEPLLMPSKRCHYLIRMDALLVVRIQSCSAMLPKRHKGTSWFAQVGLPAGRSVNTRPCPILIHNSFKGGGHTSSPTLGKIHWCSVKLPLVDDSGFTTAIDGAYAMCHNIGNKSSCRPMPSKATVLHMTADPRATSCSRYSPVTALVTLHGVVRMLRMTMTGWKPKLPRDTLRQRANTSLQVEPPH